MALIVQKYGGTSVGDLERIHLVADKVKKAHGEGHKIVVVVSAMSGETDRLVSLANQFSQRPDPREVDVLLSTGEQVSIALLSLALLERGCPARSYTGAQVHIRTDSVHNKARILGIESSRIRSDLQSGKVVVVAGFQGVDELGNITTLGRGGSDTTAVALAAALEADECQIYTDVEGVYSADPALVPDARKMTQITFEEMLELSSLGVKVMQNRAVEFAGKYKVPVRVLSTFKEGQGTLISTDEAVLSHVSVSGVAISRAQAKITFFGIHHSHDVMAKLLKPLSEAHIEVDMMMQTLNRNGKTDLSFMLHKRDFPHALEIMQKLKTELKAEEIVSSSDLGKLSLVGGGMRSNPKVLSQLFETLASFGIAIQLVSTSEIKVSVVVEEKHLDTGARALHDAFQLGCNTNDKL